MLFPEIVESRVLSIEEKITRLRYLEANLRSLDRALYGTAGQTPLREELVEIETEIRLLTHTPRTTPGSTARFDRSRGCGDYIQGETPNAHQGKGS